MFKESHPYISKHFNPATSCKYLIIGTFPPNKKIREGKKSLTDYFYGNKGTLWKILGKIYTEFDFENGTRHELVTRMKEWQKKYEVGITDTLLSVSRRDVNSANDADLILTDSDYYHDLKAYVLNNNDNIKKILFTSSKGPKSAFETFKTIMGSDIAQIKADLVTNLPSPSGSSNISWFNLNNESTLGLHQDFYKFLVSEKNDCLHFFNERWTNKKIKKVNKSKEKLPSCPKGLLNEFKVWSYKKVLPLPYNTL